MSISDLVATRSIWGRSASSFDELNAELAKPLTFTDHYLIRLLAGRMKEYRPEVVAITVPFPGNLYSALRCGEWIKVNYPEVTVVMVGEFPTRNCDR